MNKNNICKICGYIGAEVGGDISYHVKKIHKLKPHDYFDKFILENKIPTCMKQGCEINLPYRKRYTPDFYLPDFDFWIEVKPFCFQDNMMDFIMSMQRCHHKQLIYLDKKQFEYFLWSLLDAQSEGNVGVFRNK